MSQPSREGVRVTANTVGLLAFPIPNGLPVRDERTVTHMIGDTAPAYAGAGSQLRGSFRISRRHNDGITEFPRG